MTFSTSRYPTLSMQFSPRFVTHEDNARVSVDSYMISQDPGVPGCEPYTRAVAALLVAYHPQFPAA